MKNPYLNIFIALAIIIAGTIAEAYSIDLANFHDDLLSGLGLVCSFGIVILMIWGTIKLFTKPKKKKTNEQTNY